MRALVVGAGPAGSMAARGLARAGIEVVLADRAAFPRDKACGDVVGPKACALLAAEGLTPPTSGHAIGEMVLAIGERAMRLPARPGLSHPGEGLSIPRLELDAWLHSLAVEAGAAPVQAVVQDVARVRGGFRARLGPTEERFDVLVGADGANSQVAKALGLVDERRALRGFALRRYLPTTVAADRIDLLARRGAPPGYGWAFRVREGLCNVGIGIAVGNDRRRVQGLRRALDGYVAELQASGVLAPWAQGAPERELGSWLRMGLGGTRVAESGCYLVGDAAGLTNALQGEGIAAAIASALGAVDAIVAHGPRGASAYRARIAEEFGASARAGYVAQALALASPGLAAWALRMVVGVGSRSERAAAGWGIFTNELSALEGPSPGVGLARFLEGLGASLAHGVPAMRQAFAPVGDEGGGRALRIAVRE